MSSKRQVERRWGVPFWRLIEDFAYQGLTRFDTARAIGYRPDSLCSLLSSNPDKDPFEPSNRPLGYLRDTGENFSQAAHRMAAEGLLATEAARIIGYRDASGLRRALESRGIEVTFKKHASKVKPPRVVPINITTGWPTWTQLGFPINRLNRAAKRKINDN